jgi:DNA-directed RNA polymerase
LAQILDRDPFRHLWWAQAENPFQFYAFCVEMSRVLDWAREHSDDPNCEHFLSSLPIAVDGSNNGMQHMCALLRDAEGARSVNLVHSDPPADLYQAVANRVKFQCEALSKEGDPAAQLWLESGMLDRKLLKRPVMTFGYGVTKQGMATQLVEEMEGRDNEFFGGDGASRDGAAWFLVDIIWSALERTVASATAAREWLMAMARKIGKKQPISWSAPTGFPVVQAYYRQTTKAINTVFGGVRYQPKLAIPTEVIDSRKQVTSITPNFVHSLDAAALVETVAAAFVVHEVTAFVTIHDSYGTVPGDMTHLWSVLRQEFKGLYAVDDPLEQIDDELRAQYDGEEDLPRPPEKGALDLDQVLDSMHFFR